MTIQVTSTGLSNPANAAPVEEKKVEESAAAPQEEAVETTSESDAEEKEAEETPEGEESQDDKKPLKGVDKRISKLVKQRSAANERAEKAERELAELRAKGEKPAQPEKEVPKAKSEGEPNIDDFDTYKDYLKAQVKWELAEEKKQDEANKKRKSEEDERKKVVDSYSAQKAELIAGEYPDFDEVVNNCTVDVPRFLLDAIIESEQSAKLTYLLSDEFEDDLARMSKLPPRAAIKELGKFEVKHLSASEEEIEEPKKLTKAPAPIKPVSSKATGSVKKSIFDRSLTQREYEELRAKQAAR